MHSTDRKEETKGNRNETFIELLNNRKHEVNCNIHRSGRSLVFVTLKLTEQSLFHLLNLFSLHFNGLKII